MKNKPAFPRPFSESTANDMVNKENGMSLLEYYAGQALAGVVASEMNLESLNRIAERNDDTTEEAVSVLCFSIAEAMIREAEKRQ